MVVKGVFARGLGLEEEEKPRYFRRGDGMEYLVRRKSMGLRGLSWAGEGMIRSQIMACEGGEEGERGG